MLYNGCLKFIKLAKRAMMEKNFEEKNTHMIKAQMIIQELRSTLDPDIELSQGLEQMYEYLYNRLVEANMKNDVEALDEVVNFVMELRDTWKQVMVLANKK